MKHKGKSNSSFRHPKQVLLFGHTRILVAIFKSMQSCAEITGTSVKTVSRACKGEYAQAAGFYFRRLHPDVEIEMADLDTLRLEEYDQLCGEVRRYLPKEQVKAFRGKFEQTYGHKKAQMETDRQLFPVL